MMVLKNERETEGKNDSKASSLNNQMASDAINQWMEGKKKKLLWKMELIEKKVQGV